MLLVPNPDLGNVVSAVAELCSLQAQVYALAVLSEPVRLLEAHVAALVKITRSRFWLLHELRQVLVRFCRGDSFWRCPRDCSWGKIQKQGLLLLFIRDHIWFQYSEGGKSTSFWFFARPSLKCWFSPFMSWMIRNDQVFWKGSAFFLMTLPGHFVQLLRMLPAILRFAAGGHEGGFPPSIGVYRVVPSLKGLSSSNCFHVFQ